MPSESRRTPPRGSRPGGRPGPGRAAAVGRPVGRPPGAAGGSGVAAPRRGSRFTGRAAVLVLVVSLLTISYASSLRAYLDQRSHIEDLKGQIALRQAAIDDLEREQRRWDDPAYVKQQARDLNYVMPGETAYVVLDANGKPLDTEATLTDPASIAAKQPKAWWSRAWRSVELAGDPPAPAPPPAAKIKEPADGSGTGVGG
jgi:cell division protein FtsB